MSLVHPVFRAAGRPDTPGRRWLVMGAMLMALGVACAEEALPGSLLDDYIVRRWGEEDGVPEAVVTAVAQAPDGFLWLATANYIARFDGERFVIPLRAELPPQLPYVLRGIHFDRLGRFWVYGGRGVWRHDGREWKDLSGLVHGPVIKVLDDAAGVMAVTPNGVYRIARDSAETYLLPEQGTINDLVAGADGTWWVTTDQGLFHLENGTLVREIIPEGDEYYAGVIAMPSGDILLKGRRHLLVRHDGAWQRWQGDEYPYIRRMRSKAILPDDEGGVWLAGDTVCRWQAGEGRVLGRQEGFRTSTVYQILKDRAGNVWMATRGGLYQFRRRVAMVVHNTTGVGSDEFLAVTTVRSNAAIMCGVAGAGVLEGSLADLHPKTVQGLSPHAVVSALLVRPDGRFGIGTQGDYLYFGGGGSNAPVTRLMHIGESINALLEDRQGVVYVGTWAGLRKIVDGRDVEVRIAGGGSKASVHALMEDRAGRIWAGYQNDGLVGFSATGGVVRLSGKDGLPGDSVRALCEDQANGLWIGTMNGLAWCKDDGHLPVFGIEQGLPNADIRQILDDGNECLWLGTAHGIVRIEKSDLEAVAQGRRTLLRVREYGIPEGLVNEECTGGYGNGCARMTDGRLLFCTKGGLAVVSPGGLFKEGESAPAVVEKVSSGTNAIWRRGMLDRKPPPDIVLAAGTRTVSILYDVPEYSAPDRIHFRHRLEGFREEWSESTTDRVAQYAGLVPGVYRLQLSMRLRNGEWKDQGVLATIVLPALFWQTLWFKGLMILAGMVLVGLAVWRVERARNARRIAVLEHDRALAEERSRIARDLHDDIGAALTRIAILGNLTRMDAGDGEATRKHGHELFNTAGRVVRSLREIVWALGAQHDHTEDCVAFISQYAQNYLSDTGIRCRLDIPDAVPDAAVDARARHALLMAFKEALANAVKHAGATEIVIRFAVESGWLRVAIEDNGRGFDPQSADASVGGGHGLDDMRERMRGCGGRFELEHLPEKGTRIVFHVPLAACRT